MTRPGSNNPDGGVAQDAGSVDAGADSDAGLGRDAQVAKRSGRYPGELAGQAAASATTVVDTGPNQSFVPDWLTKKLHEESKISHITFNEQAFLWDFIELFQNLNPMAPKPEPSNKKTSDETEPEEHYELIKPGDEVAERIKTKAPYSYSNFTQISNPEPSTTLNQLAGRGVDSLDGLTTAQISSLTPYIRIYKVIPYIDEQTLKPKERNILFPFSTHTTVESIITSLESQGIDAGIKSIQFKDLGTNPENVGFAFQGTMNLYFQSFESLFVPRSVDNNKLTFLDLLDHSSALGVRRKAPSDIDSKAYSTNLNNTEGFKIKLEIGWNAPNGEYWKQGEKLPSGFADKLERLKRSYIILPYRQEIKMINDTGGAIDLKISFAARIEAMAEAGAGADLLSINEFDNKTLEVQRGAQNTLRDLKKRTSQIADHPDYTNDIVKEIQYLQQELGEATTQLRSLTYERIFKALRKSSVGADNPNKERIFFIDLDENDIRTYKLMLGQAVQANKNMKADTKNKQARDIEEEVESYRQDRLIMKKAIFKNIVDAPTGENSDFAPWLPKKDIVSGMKENQEAANPSGNNAGSSSGVELVGGKYRLHFFFLGDLLEAAMSILYNTDKPIPEADKVYEEYVDPKTGMGYSEQPQDQSRRAKSDKMRKELRLLTSPFIYTDPSSKKELIMDLADIPVSLNFFNAWFFDRIISQRKDHYFLRNFLNDLCSHLLDTVLSPNVYGVLAGFNQLRANVQSITGKKDDYLDEVWDNKSWIKRIDIDDIRKGKRGQGNSTTEWLYLSIVGNQTRFLIGNHSSDQSLSVPHLFVGADTGTVKNINFSQIKIPYLLPALLRKESQSIRANLIFAERYDATLKLIGNPAYKPGMLVFIDPKALGLGLTLNENQAWKADIGIGGYYFIHRVEHTISAEKFETKLTAILQTSVRTINRQIRDELAQSGMPDDDGQGDENEEVIY